MHSVVHYMFIKLELYQQITSLNNSHYRLEDEGSLLFIIGPSNQLDSVFYQPAEPISQICTVDPDPSALRAILNSTVSGKYSICSN